MGLPDRAAIEAFQRRLAGLHALEAAHPDEVAGRVEVAELAQQAHAVRLLALDEFALEQVDQVVAPAGLIRYWRSSITVWAVMANPRRWSRRGP
jgi:anaerobic glycerol-3-phosphate dehydrogenase